jgi:hypothetical protein
LAVQGDYLVCVEHHWIAVLAVAREPGESFDAGRALTG